MLRLGRASALQTHNQAWDKRSVVGCGSSRVSKGRISSKGHRRLHMAPQNLSPVSRTMGGLGRATVPRCKDNSEGTRD